METALYISSNLLHVYSVYIFFQTMLKKSCLSKWLEVSTFLGYYVLNSLGFLIYNSAAADNISVQGSFLGTEDIQRIFSLCPWNVRRSSCFFSTAFRLSAG